MSNGMNDLGGGYSARESYARGASVNDTAPGVDGSVLGVNMVPASDEDSGRRYALANRLRDTLTSQLRGRSRSIVVAAVGFGLLALGTFLTGRRRSRRAPVSLFGSRSRRGWFVR